MMAEREVRHIEGNEAVEPVKLIIFTDPGRDQDDSMAFIAARRLQKILELGILGSITTLSPTQERAELLSYLVQYLGMKDVEIAAGYDTNPNALRFPYEFRRIPSHYNKDSIHPDPNVLLDAILTNAAEKSIDVLIIAGFTDVDRYLQDPDRKALWINKVKNVTVMGGVKSAFYKLSSDGHIQLDASANYGFDPKAAKRSLDFMQDANIPISFVSRHAAGEVKLPKDVFDSIAKESNNPVAEYVRQGVAGGLQHLWERVHMTADDPRRKLPERCDATWFSKNFCKQAELPTDSSADIWPYIVEITPYDVLALIAVIPSLRDRFFDPYHATLHGTTHTIIGPSEHNSSVKNPEELKQFISECLVHGIEKLIEASKPMQLVTEKEIVSDRFGTARVNVSSEEFVVASLGADAIPTDVYVTDGCTVDGDTLFRVQNVTMSPDGDLVFSNTPPVYEFI